MHFFSFVLLIIGALINAPYSSAMENERSAVVPYISSHYQENKDVPLFNQLEKLPPEVQSQIYFPFNDLEDDPYKIIPAVAPLYCVNKAMQQLLEDKKYTPQDLYRRFRNRFRYADNELLPFFANSCPAIKIRLMRGTRMRALLQNYSLTVKDSKQGVDIFFMQLKNFFVSESEDNRELAYKTVLNYTWWIPRYRNRIDFDPSGIYSPLGYALEEEQYCLALRLLEEGALPDQCSINLNSQQMGLTELAIALIKADTLISTQYCTNNYLTNQKTIRSELLYNIIHTLVKKGANCDLVQMNRKRLKQNYRNLKECYLQKFEAAIEARVQTDTYKKQTQYSEHIAKLFPPGITVTTKNGKTYFIKNMSEYLLKQYEKLNPQPWLCSYATRTSILDFFLQTHPTVDDRSKIIPLLIDQYGINPNRSDHEGMTPLHTAIEYGYTDVVELLCSPERKIKADVNVQDKRKMTPLYIAARNLFIEGMRLLLQLGADPEMDPEGCAILGALLRTQHRVDLHENISQRCKTAEFFLEKIKERYSPEQIKRVLDTKYDNRTPLEWAMMYQDSNLLKLFLTYGADPNLNFPVRTAHDVDSDGGYTKMDMP